MAITEQANNISLLSTLWRIRYVFLCLVFYTQFVGQASAAVDAFTPVATDSRIKTFVYSENDVFNIVTHYGYQSNIEFGVQEEVETISVGDRVPFQVIPAGRRLFIRAMMANARTNMTVVTNKHAYQFDITSVPAPVMPNEELVYVVRFFYPDDKKNLPSPYQGVIRANEPEMASVQIDSAPSYNYKYTFSGSDAIAPLKVFDDGKATYFKFQKVAGSPALAIFSMDEYGKETLVTEHISGEYLVVDSVAPRFSIKQGDYSVLIYNDKMIHN